MVQILARNFNLSDVSTSEIDLLSAWTERALVCRDGSDWARGLYKTG